MKKFILHIVIPLAIFSCDKDARNSIYMNNSELIREQIILSEIEENSEKVEEEYIQNDIKVIDEIINELAEIRPYTTNFAKFYPSILDPDYGENYGFGIRSFIGPIYGGYGSYWIKIIYFKNRILQLRIDMTFTSQNLYFVDKFILKSIEFPIEISGKDEIYFERNYPWNLEDYWNSTGYSILDYDLNSTHTGHEFEMFDILNSQQIGLRYDCKERNCGGGTAGPYQSKGRLAMDSLDKMKSYSLIEKTLNSFNPVSRIYALEKLEELERRNEIKIDKTTKEHIDVIKNSDVNIYLCNWCPFQRQKETYSYREVEETLNKIKLE